MLTKFAFFDFDDTLIHGDSGGKLLKYYLKKHPLSVFKLLKVVYHYALYLKIEPLNKAKSAWLYPLDKMSDQEIEKFYQEVLEPCYYLNVIEELKKKKAEGYTIYICSASVEAYLRFCKLPVDEILGTKTVINDDKITVISSMIKDGKYTSQMIGNNCKNEEKVKRIQEVIKNHNLEIDYDLSYAYSYSLHDIPMLKMVKNRIKIDTKDGHMSTFEIE